MAIERNIFKFTMPNGEPSRRSNLTRKHRNITLLTASADARIEILRRKVFAYRSQ
jgi:hypothetical protein